MNTSVRARHDARGFSFIELLVTLIIAGIAFAALVPVFVGAQKATAGDQLRNVTLQLAQDKIEKVRSLDYDLITTPNLQSGTFANGQFGTNVAWATGGGNTRDFRVDYRVDLLPAGSAAGAESYKQVTITASWSAPPSPVKPVLLSTMVSKQYAGPQIIRFDVGPPSILGEGSGSTVFTSGPVVLDVYIAAEDIQSMNQSAIEANRGYVLFTVTSLSGTFQGSSGKVTAPVLGEPAHYQFTWNNLDPAAPAPDGPYLFAAVAVAGFGSRAQGIPVSLALAYTTHAPQAPTGLQAQVVGDASVTLKWGPSAATDVVSYEVWRSADGITFAKVGTSPGSLTAFEDATVTNGVNYYYKVRAVDSEVPALMSPYTPAIQTMPYVPKDNTPPGVPSPVTAAAVASQPTVHLSWPTSVDSGTPASGLAGYNIDRSADGTTWIPLLILYPGESYDDITAGWAKTWWYRVQAVDKVNNSSGYAQAGPVTTVAMPLRVIKVTNNKPNASVKVHVWVQNFGTPQWYDQTSGAPGSLNPATIGVKLQQGAGQAQSWTKLPPGIYNVFFRSTDTWDTTTPPLKTQVVDVNAGDGVATIE